MAFDLNRGWRLNPAVSLRPEPFGALVYHFGNRRLSFLKSQQLVTVVQLLAITTVRPTRWPLRACPSSSGGLHRGAGGTGRFGGYRCTLTRPVCPAEPPA